MTEPTPTIDSRKLKENLEKLEELNQRFLNVLAQKKPSNPATLGPGHEFFSDTLTSIMQDSINNPARLFELQVSYWGESLQNWIRLKESMFLASETQHASKNSPHSTSLGGDFWKTNPLFKLVKEQYETNAAAVRRALTDIDGLDDAQRQRLAFFSGQIVEMMSPANFLATNPEALERAASTGGESLVRGLENLVRDLEHNDGELLVTLADRDAFSVGDNLATSQGDVVYRNELFELIQFSPTTEKVHRIPLLIVPPWINKYYILDLKPENSLIGWLVNRGFTVFIMSWVNPTERHRDIGMDAYASDGCLTAINEVKKITEENKVNVVGYCIGGTLLALVLAYMSRTRNQSVRSATFFTTLTDFTELGELSVFVENDFLAGIESEVERRGYLPSLFMSRTFSFMRANDLVYAPAVRLYLMGEAPPAFDLLYWNGDSTNLPARMTVEYLRRLCQRNEFATQGFDLLGEKVTLRDVRHPLFAIACETDHIANWPGSYRGIVSMASRDKTFVLSQSGHIAGIVNPPSRDRYGYYTADKLARTASQWQANATFNEGSWWRLWGDWLARRSGAMIDSSAMTGGKTPSLGTAPGTYVLASHSASGA